MSYIKAYSYNFGKPRDEQASYCTDNLLFCKSFVHFETLCCLRVWREGAFFHDPVFERGAGDDLRIYWVSLRATRNPLTSSRKVIISELRRAERRTSGSSYQEPPRNTRNSFPTRISLHTLRVSPL